MGQITLSNIGGGAAVEKFEDEFRRVVDNILDPNTPAKATRKVVLTIEIKPSADRSFGPVTVSATSKLPPRKSFSTVAFFGRDGGDPVAFEENPAQVTVQDFIAKKEEVATIKPKIEASK